MYKKFLSKKDSLRQLIERRVEVLDVHILRSISLRQIQVEKEERFERPIQRKVGSDAVGELIHKREGSIGSPIHEPLRVVL